MLIHNHVVPMDAMADLVGDKSIHDHSVEQLELLWLEVKKAE